MIRYFIVFISIFSFSISTEHNTTKTHLPACSTIDFTINDVSLDDMLQAIDEACGLNIIYKDKFVKEILKSKKRTIELENISLNKTLDIILSQNDISHSLESNILSVWFLKTQTFDINYIATTRIGSSNTDVIFSQEGNIGAIGLNNLGGNYNNTHLQTSNTNTIEYDKALNLATNTNALSSGKSGSKIYSIDSVDLWGELENEIYNIAYRPGDAYIPKQEKDNIHKAIVINKGAGLLSVTGSAKQIARVAKYVSTLNKKLQTQVLIDVNILNVSHTDQGTTGVDWGELFKLGALSIDGVLESSRALTTGANTAGQSQSPVLSFSNDGNQYGVGVFAPNVSLTQIITFLKTYGKVESVSNPRVLTLNNQPAMISVGSVLRYIQNTTYQSSTTSASIQNNQQNYPSVFSGILLDATPSIKDEYIILKINSSMTKSLDSSIEQNPVALDSPPNLSTKQLSSLVKIKDGQKIVLGGLINKTTSDTTSYVPILGRIPLLKYLFSYNSKVNNTDEMLIVITPKIIYFD